MPQKNVKYTKINLTRLNRLLDAIAAPHSGWLEEDREIAKASSDAIRAFISRNANSLDTAFGQRIPRQSRELGKKMQLKKARQIRRLRIQGRAWKEVMRILRWPGSESGIKKLYERYEPEITSQISKSKTKLMAARLSRRMGRNLERT
jgi:hypothetical protein